MENSDFTEQEINLKCVVQNPPLHPINQEDYICGIDLIDHFAGLAMQAICTNAGRKAYNLKSPTTIAQVSYEMAFAMLRARKEILKNE